MSEEVVEVQEQVETTELEESEPTYTQRQFEDAMKERLGREKGKTKAAREEANSYRSEIEQLRSELEALKHKDELRQWVEEVSAESGIPASVLRGSTKEELQAHAEALKPLLMPQSTAPVVSSEGTKQVKTASTSDPIRDFIINRS